MKLPRLLPLIAVAIGGVIAINALAGANSLPDMLTSARAYAEDAVATVTPKGKGKGKAGETKVAEAKVAEAPVDKSAVSPVPTDRILDAEAQAKAGAVCTPGAEALAKQAGLSSAELKMIQDLGTRRGQIDALEKNVDVQQQLMTAAEAKVDAKLKALQASIAEMKGLLGQADEKKKVETARLVTIYEGMKPDQAALQLEIMKDDVRLDITSAMKPRALSAILNKMKPAAAKDLTEKLAMRYAASDAAKAAAMAAPAATAAAPAPTKVAAAAPPKAAAPKAPAPKAPAPTATAPKAAPAAPPPAAQTPAAAAAPPVAAPATPPTG